MVIHDICVICWSFGELLFYPGVTQLEIAVNVIDDDIPEDEEHFHVKLKNPKGGAEIGFNSQVTITISSNDDAYGIIGFTQVILSETHTCVLDVASIIRALKESFC